MKKTNNNLILLGMVFAVALITANVVSAKVFTTGWSLFGLPLNCTVGAFCYAITYLVTDIIGETWGRETSQLFVKGGFISQIISTALIVILLYPTAVDPQMQSAYETLLGQNWLFVIGSLTAYLCSQSWDVFVFHKLRDLVMKRTGSNRHRWIWNNVGTCTAQLIDTAIFNIIPFGFGFGYLWSAEGRIALGGMIIAQYFIKVILALLDTPFFYLLTKEVKTDDVA